MSTLVVNFKAVKKHWDRETQTWDDAQYVYIGRAELRTYKLPQSPWANPFQMGAESQRQAVIDLYRRYIADRIMDGLLDLEALRGKTLVCWCKQPDKEVACHGDVILQLLGEE